MTTPQQLLYAVNMACKNALLTPVRPITYDFYITINIVKTTVDLMGKEEQN
jgi:hypothetical protein